MSNKVKLFVILGVSSFVVVVIGAFLMTGGQKIGQAIFGRSFAEGELKDYVKTVLRQDINGGRCQAMDTNENGYVSCDYTTATDPNTPRSIECAAWGWDGFLNRGCKSRVPTFR